MKPKIRLKGFEEEWEKKPLRDLCYKEASSISKDSLGTSEGQYPIFGASGYIQNIDYYQQENIYVGIVKDGAGVGRANVYPAKSSLLGTMQYILPKANTDVDFLGYLLNKTDLSIYNTGSTIPHIYFKDYGEQMVLAPGFPEQQSIATYFKSLDALIQATTKKVVQLKQLKAASLISMFPQEGETKPKVRFKGFEGEWESKKLNECLTISGDVNDKGVYGIEDVLSVSDDFGVMNQIELLGRSYAGKSVTSYGILKTGEIVYTKSPLKSKPFGIIKENTGKTGIVSVLYAVYVPKDNVCASYIHYYFTPDWRLNDYLRPLINKGAKNTMNISDETALTGEIMIPSEIEEQQRIASYFQNLDTQIHLQEQRLEKLKQIKTACLEQMFV